jgi:hypothetical protein
MTKRQLNNLKYGDKIVHIEHQSEYRYYGTIQVNIDYSWHQMQSYYNNDGRYARTTDDFIKTFDNVK